MIRFRFFLTAAVLLAVGLSWAGSGASPSDPVTTVSELITAFGKGGVVYIAPGTYDFSGSTLNSPKSKGWSTSDARSAYLLHNGAVELRNTCTKPRQERTAEEEVVLDAANKGRLVYIYGGGARDNFRAYGITFANANATCAADGGASGDQNYGNGSGAMALGPANGIVSNCVFRNCKAESNGGGVYCYRSMDSIFVNCTAGKKGGGTYIDGQDPYKSHTNTAERCVFTDCTADMGGGIFANQLGAVKGAKAGYITDCVFSNNLAKSQGGGIYAAYLGTLSNCVFAANAATNSGGAVFVGTCTPNAPYANCRFEGNRTISSGDGGALYSNAGAVSLTNCTFVANSSAKNGGAVYAHSGVGTIVDCNVCSNKAANMSGGIYSELISQAFTGTISDSYFCDNTNIIHASSIGAHLRQIKNVEHCVFRGIGDVNAKNLNRCEFDRCSYTFVLNQYSTDSMIRFDANSGNGIIRNCVFHDCKVSRFVVSDSDTRNLIENCTFDNNTTYNSYVHAMRAAANKPAFTDIRNCLFTRRGKQTGVLIWNGIDVGDTVDFKATTTSANATNYCYSCQFDVKPQSDGGGFYTDRNCKDGAEVSPRYVAGDARYPDAPFYMLRPGSSALAAGEWRDWMNGAVDQAGTPFDTVAKKPNIGAYQGSLQASGGLFLISR